ncbi:hypothetical protein LGZ99_23930 [Photorhabdus temperata]|uniref:Uncharacterized protein n=2 Tax=Photorhabdus TaxID=29487 RepID=A0A0A0CW53_9GAMM|nr:MULTISPECIES: hypothetical protein [Photorhabdus]KGM29092.1 hypothetical protein KS18_04815 [Photorhabdus luminescens]MBS9426783.1 hypothetical protein [Photorhabdus akhurstii]MBS9431146.1 hypothetical protein [Photorhabdus hainanensis]MCC8456213.1 hypothetical protein [Photorhabdus aegyptia]MCT8350160.1 hypothetical protein [Photorhabdus temperata]
MRKPITLDDAKYRSGLACSLYEVITSMADKEKCSGELCELIALVCDINYEVNCSLESALGTDKLNLD